MRSQIQYVGDKIRITYKSHASLKHEGLRLRRKGIDVKAQGLTLDICKRCFEHGYACSFHWEG